MVTGGCFIFYLPSLYRGAPRCPPVAHVVVITSPLASLTPAASLQLDPIPNTSTQPTCAYIADLSWFICCHAAG